jgi:hypothetical protein
MWESPEVHCNRTRLTVPPNNLPPIRLITHIKYTETRTKGDTHAGTLLTKRRSHQKHR